MTAFEIIRESVDIIDAAKRYGITVNRHKKALCPFHNDRNPSLSFKGQRFKCFGCGADGDVIDLVGGLINRAPMETAREINQTYRLGIDMDKPTPSTEVMRRKRQQAEKKIFTQWIDKAGFTLANYLHLLREWRTAYAPKHPDDELDPRFLEALQQYDYTDYVFNTVFIEGDLNEKMTFYNQSRQMVERIAQCLAKERDSHAGGTGANNNPSGIVFPFEFAAAGFSQKAA